MNVPAATLISTSARPTDELAAKRERVDGMRFHLRHATRDEHDATEAAFACFDLSTRDGYRDFLLAHAGALAALEPSLRNGGWSGWTSRRHLLQTDLRDLGILLLPDLVEGAVSLPSDAHLWGAQYVLEGSRLGGAVLARNVPAGCPVRYLDTSASDQVSATRPWQEFCCSLEEIAKHQGGSWKDDVEQGARTAFALFRHHANTTSGHVS
ncbi:biliverdin-producing heme oxygenase [Aurantiacibacter odishensis]|uniref:biliverdin-producing heme oxygenase n=1 Tax=Aurantiacibacter odishensis TaxID=1155476 RepID=UPI001F0C4166|nr:biliverdin-producing heme oxygenase [Aurantiacibacter odishensis]